MMLLCVGYDIDATALETKTKNAFYQLIIFTFV